MSGWITGLTCSFIYTPTEYAKIHCQTTKNPMAGSASIIWQTIKNEKMEGIRKLYTGHRLTMAKETIGSAIYYGNFHIMLNKVCGEKRETAHLYYQALCGSLSGIMYQLYSYPLDTIKTNLQSGRKSVCQMLKGKFWN